MDKKFDWIIIGAGIYGLYGAKILSRRKNRVALLEYDSECFQRASYINQARIHNGYHYPRSFSTAIKSAGYFAQFNQDFEFAINNKFLKIYAISSNYSYTPAENFLKFCNHVNIPCKEISPEEYFIKNTIENAFLTEESSFDSLLIRDRFLEELEEKENVALYYDVRIQDIEKKNDCYSLIFNGEHHLSAPAVLNATYASINQILDKFQFEKLKIKSEICEIILCKTSNNIKDVGITIMDGPFFSIMPFGLTGYHSLSSVQFTPHATSYEPLPNFPCQKSNAKCTPKDLANCNLCSAKPKTAWKYMRQLTKKYLRPSIQLDYHESLFAIKPILMASELDDSRPTVIRSFSEDPTFISVLSGKINCIYDLKEVLL